jgi:hypothetical protein
MRGLRSRRDAGPANPSPHWTRPPERPSSYRLRDRLADMACGYLDGRKGIPELIRPTEPDEPPQQPADAGPASPPLRVRTPRIDAIIHEANVLIETEHCNLIEERALLRRQLTESEAALDSSAEESLTTAARLAGAHVGLTAQQLEQRRLAEADQRNRPLALVMARRKSAWDRQLASAERRNQAVTAQASQARHQATLSRDLMADREEAARAAARRHQELAHRRIATYLQQLVRTHPEGRKLNDSFSEFQVDPELPEWAREPRSLRTRAEPEPGDGGPHGSEPISEPTSERQ